MAKLKCGKHERRVQLLPDGKAVHRQDGSSCSTQYVMIGSNVFIKSEVVACQNEISDDTASLMLGAIFRDGNVPAGVRLVPLKHLVRPEVVAEQAEKKRHPRRRKGGNDQKAAPKKTTT